MDINSRLALSYYKEISVLNKEHAIYLVQHTESGYIYVKKSMNIYNKAVFEQLKSHPVLGIPRVIELFEDDNCLIVIEEYIQGKTINELLETGHVFTNTEIHSVFLELCYILNRLHSQATPVIHRDIKPSNVIINDYGHPSLIDLNAAKLQTFGKEEDTVLLGTKGYAAPEQYGFGTSNIQTDIYALGMLINTMVLGHFSSSPCETSIFTAIIKKCIQLNSKDRYKSTLEIAAILNGLTPDIPYTQTSSQSVSQPVNQPANQPPTPQFHQNTQPQTSQPAMHNSQPASADSMRKYLPPGYRSGDKVKMVLASFGYFYLIYCSASAKFSDQTPLHRVLLRFDGFITIMVFIAVYFNYLGIHKRLGLTSTTNRFVRSIKATLYSIVFSILTFALLTTIILYVL